MVEEIERNGFVLKVFLDRAVCQLTQLTEVVDATPPAQCKYDTVSFRYVLDCIPTEPVHAEVPCGHGDAFGPRQDDP
jgi:hypothetical protein